MKIKPLLCHHRSNGFTVIETAITIGITALISLVVFQFVSSTTNLKDWFSTQTTANATARKALHRMTPWLREADDGEDGNYPLIAAEATALTFYSDIDNDSDREQVQYVLNDTTLEQVTIEPTGSPATYPLANAVQSTIAHDIVNTSLSAKPIFTYYDQTNTVLPLPVDLKDITLIKVSLDINVAGTDPAETTTLETLIQLRNLKTNL